MNRHFVRAFTFICCSIGVLLHLYTALFEADGGLNLFLIGLLLWSCLPYAAWALCARWPASQTFALGAAAASLAADGFMHYSVFIAPGSSTAAIGLLFMPMWNLIAIGPAVGMAVWGVERLVGVARSAQGGATPSTTP